MANYLISNKHTDDEEKKGASGNPHFITAEHPENKFSNPGNLDWSWAFYNGDNCACASLRRAHKPTGPPTQQKEGCWPSNSLMPGQCQWGCPGIEPSSALLLSGGHIKYLTPCCCSIHSNIPANTIRWTNIRSMLGPRRRRRTNIDPTLVLFAGIRLLITGG